MVNDRVKRTEGQNGRAAEQVFRKCEMMPSGLVAVSRGLPETFPPFQVQKREFRSSWVQLQYMGTDREGLGTQHFEANTELRNSAFSRVESAEVPLEVRKGMKGEHIPETNLIRH